MGAWAPTGEVRRGKREVKGQMLTRRRKWLPRVLERRSELRAGRMFTVELLAPVTRADLCADGCTFKRRSAGAVLR